MNDQAGKSGAEGLESALQKQAAGRRARRGRARALILVVPLALIAGGAWVWLSGGRFVTTDNAYVHQPIVPVSSDVAGRIVEVMVGENQSVTAGEALFRVDPEPYRIALDQAEAALASARLAAEQQRTAYVTAQTRLTATEGVLDLSQREYERQKALADKGITSASALDNARLAVQSAENNVTYAGLSVREALAAIGGDPERAIDDFPAVRAALATREAAARNLAKAGILAPVAGVVSEIGSLNVGQYVGAGTEIASLVETDVSWIEANFKETQLAGLHPGQRVGVEIDAYPGVAFDGEIESISSATGSQFSLIPAQNATGNWVKVVQRIPVRIAIASDAAHPLRGGMSASVSVDTGATRLDRLTR